MAEVSGHQPHSEQLFACLAEQVKIPFVQVLRAAELLSLQDENAAKEAQQTIQEVSQATIQLIDGFLLQTRLQQEAQLQLEPVSLGSAAYDVVEMLRPFARLHNCELRIDIQGKYGPVMAHRPGLTAALVNIGYGLIEAGNSTKPRLITLGVRRDKKGISAGLYTEGGELTSGMLKQARSMRSDAHQPFAGFSSTNAAGIFIADGLLAHIGAPLRVSRFRKTSGLAATFLPSRQLSLV